MIHLFTSGTATDAALVVAMLPVLQAHGIRDFGWLGPSDLFTDLGSQPLDNSDVPKGRTRYTAEASRLGFEASTPLAGGPLATLKNLDLGLELIQGQRKNFADGVGTMKRMDVLARYSF